MQPSVTICDSKRSFCTPKCLSSHCPFFSVLASIVPCWLCGSHPLQSAFAPKEFLLCSTFYQAAVPRGLRQTSETLSLWCLLPSSQSSRPSRSSLSAIDHALLRLTFPKGSLKVPAGRRSGDMGTALLACLFWQIAIFLQVSEAGLSLSGPYVVVFGVKFPP